MEAFVYDYDLFREMKCATCDKIEAKDAVVWARKGINDGWQMASNLPFHYVCSKQCEEILKEMIERYKEEAKQRKKAKNG